MFSNCDTTAHAEVDLLRNTSDKLLDINNKQFIKNNFTLYSTCEPCPMCTGTILLSNIKSVVWAANDDEAGAIRKMKEGPHFLYWLDQINYIAAPYEDLEMRQGKLMLDFYTSRGFHDTHWHRKYNYVTK